MNLITQFASDIIGLMNVLKIKKAHILGSSMGGMVAQEIAINYPESVEKLILCSTHCEGKKKINPSQEILEMMVSPNQDLIDGIITLYFTQRIIKNNARLI